MDINTMSTHYRSCLFEWYCSLAHDLHFIFLFVLTHTLVLMNEGYILSFFYVSWIVSRLLGYEYQPHAHLAHTVELVWNLYLYGYHKWLKITREHWWSLDMLKLQLTISYSTSLVWQTSPIPPLMPNILHHQS